MGHNDRTSWPILSIHYSLALGAAALGLGFAKDRLGPFGNGPAEDGNRLLCCEEARIESALGRVCHAAANGAARLAAKRVAENLGHARWRPLHRTQLVIQTAAVRKLVSVGTSQRACVRARRWLTYRRRPRSRSSVAPPWLSRRIPPPRSSDEPRSTLRVRRG